MTTPPINVNYPSLPPVPEAEDLASKANDFETAPSPQPSAPSAEDLAYEGLGLEEPAGGKLAPMINCFEMTPLDKLPFLKAIQLSDKERMDLLASNQKDLEAFETRMVKGALDTDALAQTLLRRALLSDRKGTWESANYNLHQKAVAAIISMGNRHYSSFNVPAIVNRTKQAMIRYIIDDPSILVTHLHAHHQTSPEKPTTWYGDLENLNKMGTWPKDPERVLNEALEGPALDVEIKIVMQLPHIQACFKSHSQYPHRITDDHFQALETALDLLENEMKYHSAHFPYRSHQLKEFIDFEISQGEDLSLLIKNAKEHHREKNYQQLDVLHEIEKKETSNSPQKELDLHGLYAKLKVIENDLRLAKLKLRFYKQLLPETDKRLAELSGSIACPPSLTPEHKALAAFRRSLTEEREIDASTLIELVNNLSQKTPLLETLHTNSLIVSPLEIEESEIQNRTTRQRILGFLIRTLSN